MMEVILREDVKSLGKAGELVRVKPGYARNFLLPRGLAFEATEGNKKRIEAEARARAYQGQRREGRRRAAARPSSPAITVTLQGKAGEEGKLFGSITSQDIAAGAGAPRATPSTSASSSWSIRSRRSASTRSPSGCSPRFTPR